jgi:hypothetical protein
VSIENKTGSYATTGSNIFQGTQIITGSLFVSQDLIIAGSSSILYVTSSQLDIATNIIKVNAQNPGTRFGGLSVIDSGSSPTVSGSIFFDSLNDQWLFIHQAIVGSPITSSVLLMGPQTFNNLGAELYPTTNRVLKSVNAEHVGNSNISDDGTTVSINSNTEITGTFVVTGTALVSGSSQISHDSTTGYVANRHIDHSAVTITAGNGLSGGGTIEANRTMSLDTSSATFITGVKSKMNTDGVISGSSQVVASLPSGTVSGSSQVLSGTGIFSGSAQLPSGLVSGSSQVLAGTTIHSGSFFNGITVVSGSGQISFNGITDKPALVSGSGQVSFNGIIDKPTLVSGSSQVSFTGLSNIPGGIVSGSVQVDLTATTNYSSGIKTRLNAEGVLSGSAQVVASLPNGTVSGSSQITYGSISGIPSGIVSGSSQVSFGSISGVPSGLVSGSSQVTGIGNAQLTNSSFNIGTTSISLGRASASQTLTGVSIDGNAGTVSNGVYTNASNTITGGRLIVGYSELSEPFVQGHFYNTSTTPGTQYGGVLSSGISQAHIRFLVGTNTWGGSGAKQWQIRVGDGSGADNMKFYSWTYGNDVLTISSNAAAVFAGNLSAANLSGTNTGDQTNITGNAGTVTNGVYTSGDQTIGGTKTFSATIVGSVNGNSATVGGITPIQFFNNMGDIHGTRTSFDASTPSYGFGFRYVQGSTNGPGTGAGQFYSWYIGLGNDYPATGSGSYGAMFAVDRNVTTPYLSVRYNENNSFGSWRRIHAGYADTAGNITAYTINQSVGTGNLPTFAGVKGSSYFDAQASSGFRIRNSNDTANTGALTRRGLWEGNSNYDPALWAETGYGLYFYSNGSANIRAYFDTSGHLLPGANNTYNLGSASLGWANIFTNDLHLSNMNKPEGNDIDGTNGTWTIQEGAENLYIINNNNGKKYKISLEEII